MAECSEIEAGGEVRTIKDATARNGVAANAAAIEEINEKIPASASTSNKMVTTLDLSNKMDKPPLSPSALNISAFENKYVYRDTPLSWLSDRQGLIKVHYANIGGGNTITLSVNGVNVDRAANYGPESDHGTMIGFVYKGQTVTINSDATGNDTLMLNAVIQEF